MVEVLTVMIPALPGGIVTEPTLSPLFARAIRSLRQSPARATLATWRSTPSCSSIGKMVSEAATCPRRL